MKIIQPSTLALLREARRTRAYTLLNCLHGYFYGRWTYFYIRVGVGEHPLSRVIVRLGSAWFALQRRLRRFIRVFAGQGARKLPQKRQRITLADTYHGKVVPLSAARQLVMVQEDIRLENLEKIIPYARARDIILKNPDHIIALECPCRSARANPCLPLDVCLIVGEPFASFVAEHHPRRSRWITSQQAVEILQAEDARGHVHHAFFKDAMLGRFYAICNCCACCCGAMQAQRNGTPMLASSGYIARVDEALCIGCGDCQEACQFGALTLDAVFSNIDESLCMGCGVCVNRCPEGALSLERAAGRGEPLEILTLMEESFESVGIIP